MQMCEQKEKDTRRCLQAASCSTFPSFLQNFPEFQEICQYYSFKCLMNRVLSKDPQAFPNFFNLSQIYRLLFNVNFKNFNSTNLDISTQKYLILYHIKILF